jgi:hypothetical protein
MDKTSKHLETWDRWSTAGGEWRDFRSNSNYMGGGGGAKQMPNASVACRSKVGKESKVSGMRRLRWASSWRPATAASINPIDSICFHARVSEILAQSQLVWPWDMERHLLPVHVSSPRQVEQ